MSIWKVKSVEERDKDAEEVIVRETSAVAVHMCMYPQVCTKFLCAVGNPLPFIRESIMLLMNAMCLSVMCT